MSHYTVLVISTSGKINVDEQLGKYSEAIEVPEYTSSIVSEENKERFLKHYKEEYNIGDMSFEKAYKEHGNSWNSNTWKLIDNRWVEKSTYNPDSKWDWYQMGGRWAGLLPLKENVKRMHEFDYHYSMDDADKIILDAKQVADQAYKKDIDFSKIDREDSLTYAILIDGTWTGPGEMGAFGMSDATDKTKEAFNIVFWDQIDKLSDEALLTVMDLHI